MVRASATISQRNAAVRGTLKTLLARGEAAGAFRPGLDALDLHMLVSGFCFYRVSNRHTLSAIFGQDLGEPARVAAQRRMIVDAVLGHLKP